MGEPGGPLLDLVQGRAGRGRVGMGEKRAALTGAGEAEALRATRAPRFEVAAQGGGEQQPSIRKVVTSAAEGREVTAAARREREVVIGDVGGCDEGGVRGRADEGELGVGPAGAHGTEERERKDGIAERVGQAHVKTCAPREPGKAAGGEVGGEGVAFLL